MMERETREKYGVRDEKKGVRQEEPWGDFARGGRKKIQVFYCLILKDDEFTSCSNAELS